MTKSERLAKAKKELEKALKKARVPELSTKHKKRGKGKNAKYCPNEIPDYTVEARHNLSNGVGNGFVIKSGAQHPDAIQFPIGNDHKSGLRLIVKTDDLKYMAGRKT